ncbi:MAG: AMP-binding protein [bacterium]|nr:AMP-binding protein [bacterium]
MEILLDIDHHERTDPALIDGASRRLLSYSTVTRLVRQEAGSFCRGNRELVFCLCRNDIRSVISYLAGLEAGHAVALLDAGSRKASLRRLIRSYRPEWIAGSEALVEDLELSPEFVPVSGSDDALPKWHGKTGETDAIHEDLAVLLPTSGTTGSPKFVRLTKKNVVSNAQSICSVLGIGTKDRAIANLPFHYSYGLSVLNSHLMSGGSVVTTHASVLERRFWETFADNDCTSFAGVPYIYQMLRRIGFEKFELSSLQGMTQAGGKLDDETILWFHEVLSARNQSLNIMYGQTEATARISCLPADALPTSVGSVGPAIPDGSLMIEQGEVVYRGPNVMMGYATCRDDLALGDELHGTLHTGDLGTLAANGFLTISGRNKRFAKVFGLRVNLEELEDRLRHHGPTAAAAAEDRIVLFCEHGTADDMESYRRRLLEELALHPTAVEVRRIDKLPTTSRGKIDYGELEGLL